MTTSPEPLERATTSVAPIDISFPDEIRRADQDQEWFEFELRGRRRKVRMHDYSTIFEVPGLYEALVYEKLGCRSPEQVVEPLRDAVVGNGKSMGDLHVLDLGAGNGIVGDLLQRSGAGRIAGIDIIPEAAMAARRDHPGVYDEYVVADMTAPDATTQRKLRAIEPNCMVTVAALGFGDIPPEAFVNTFNLLPDSDAWLAMCIKETFLETDDDSGFGRLIRGMVSDGTIELHHQERYVHRYSIEGRELHYVALVGRKKRDVAPHKD